MEDIFYEIFESLPRQGPGDEVSTRKAFQKLTDLPEYPEILDAGCGTGGQTLILAKLSLGNITALDNHAPFIEKLKHDASQKGLSERMYCIVGDMAAMNFSEKSFDVIWSEGAAYCMGFENALRSWKTLLKPKGYLVVSELIWFIKEASQEIKDFFAMEYPDMKYHEDIYSIIKSVGYELIDYFPLPSKSWRTDYYEPAEKKIKEMRIKYSTNIEAQSIFDSFQKEIDMYKKYSKYYGYNFYIMRKIE